MERQAWRHAAGKMRAPFASSNIFGWTQLLLGSLPPVFLLSWGKTSQAAGEEGKAGLLEPLSWSLAQPGLLCPV